MVGIFLLVGEYGPSLGGPSSGDANAAGLGVEIQSVPALNGGKARHFFARSRIHHDHLRRLASADEKAVACGIERPVARALTTHRPSGNHLTLRGIDYLNLAVGGYEAKQP